MALPGYAALLLDACGLTFLSWMAAFFRDALLGDLVEFLAYTAWLATAFLFIVGRGDGSSTGARVILSSLSHVATFPPLGTQEQLALAGLAVAKRGQ